MIDHELMRIQSPLPALAAQLTDLRDALGADS